jgi:LmeA-like phospholipid-binding
MRKLLVFLILLAAMAIAGDRLAAGLVADEAERRLASEGFRGSSVTMHGIPFLTQLAARRFDRVTVRADALEAGDGQARTVDAELTDVRAPKSGPVRVGALTASGTVPYDVVYRAVGSPELQLAPAPGGEVEVTRTVEVAGQSFDVVARARVQARGTRLRIVPTDLQVAGLPSLDDRLSALISDRVALVYDIPDLPSGVRVERVTATEEGFLVRVSGRELSVNVSALGIPTSG